MENELEIDAMKLTPEQRFLLRKQIIRLKNQGKSTKEVVEITGAKERHVQSTYKKYLEGGMDAIRLKTMGRPKGKTTKLTAEQQLEIRKAIVDKNPDQLKLKGCLWDRKNIKDLIKRKFNIDIPLSTLGYYLARWGFSAQRPTLKNYKQNPKEVEKWLEDDYPKIKARAKDEKGEIFWGDETGIQNETNYIRGYAPIGQTPILETGEYRLKVNMISAITNQGKLRFMIYKDSMNQQRLLTFFRRLIKSSDKKVFMILDNLKVHHGKIVGAWLAKNTDKIEVFFLPSYSPEYNPDEYLNGNLKREIAKLPFAKTIADIESNTRGIMKKFQSNKGHVKSYFRHEKITYAGE